MITNQQGESFFHRYSWIHQKHNAEVAKIHLALALAGIKLHKHKHSGKKEKKEGEKTELWLEVTDWSDLMMDFK